MKCGVVRFSTLGITGRMDAKYNLQVVEWLATHHLEETPANVRRAVATLNYQQEQQRKRARELRDEAARLIAEARRLEEES